MKKSCKLDFCFFLAKWFGSDWKMFLALLVVGMYLFCLLHQKIKSDKSDNDTHVCHFDTSSPSFFLGKGLVPVLRFRIGLGIGIGDP